METETMTAAPSASRDLESFIERLSERLGTTANARVVYGEPVERHGTTIIPVAKVRYGFGGGTGRKEHKNQSGAGAGAGAMIVPVGYIEMSGTAVKFRRIRLTSPLLTVAAVTLGALLILRTLAARTA
jgi:uncharacterized spore protein YtfJ